MRLSTAPFACCRSGAGSVEAAGCSCDRCGGAVRGGAWHDRHDSRGACCCDLRGALEGSNVSELPQAVDEHIRKVEGGFQNDPRDPGNWTGGSVGSGQLVGTKFGISAAANPGVDIPNLTWPQAEDLYFDRYWSPMGLQQEWDRGRRAYALLMMDAGLHSGPSRATRWDAEADGDKFLAVALRLAYLANLTTLWETYGRGWTLRVASLMRSAAELDAEQDRPKAVQEFEAFLYDRRSLTPRIVTLLRPLAGARVRVESLGVGTDARELALLDAE